MGNVPAVLISNYEIRREAHLTNNSKIMGRFQLPALEGLVSKDVIFKKDHSEWIQFRKVFHSHLFGLHKLRPLLFRLEEESQSMTNKINLLLKDSLDKEIDIVPLIEECSLDSFGRVAFGTSIVDQNHNVMKAVNIVFTVLGSQRLSDFIPILRFQSNKEVNQSIDYIEKWLLNLLDQRSRAVDVFDKSFKPESFLDFALQQLGKSADPKEKTNWLFALIDLLFAGVDTTASIMILALMSFAMNPQITKKACEEIDRQLPNKKQVRYEDMNSLHYTRAAIYESMRYLPCAALSLPRVVTCEDGELTLSGYDIPKGTLVFLNEWYLMNNERFWENPEKFVPERFLDENNEFKDDFFVPFGYGSRNCVGANFAEAEMIMIVATLIQNFTFSLPANFKYDPELRTSLRPKGNTLKMKITPR
eukprot:TRINITY_DN929_c0_g2_i1.p1 TRINITY_DN929_c0_g2~~TRINITY_DN929_c0_g2_i1.p1  ORF type:complete len:418 (+),score=77.45 TRINITY_DN929_c0_g2_i1:346-1599(+)